LQLSVAAGRAVAQRSPTDVLSVFAEMKQRSLAEVAKERAAKARKAVNPSHLRAALRRMFEKEGVSSSSSSPSSPQAPWTAAAGAAIEAEAQADV
jgi:hypothetical protein